MQACGLHEVSVGVVHPDAPAVIHPLEAAEFASLQEADFTEHAVIEEIVHLDAPAVIHPLESAEFVSTQEPHRLLPTHRLLPVPVGIVYNGAGPVRRRGRPVLWADFGGPRLCH